MLVKVALKSPDLGHQHISPYSNCASDGLQLTSQVLAAKPFTFRNFGLLGVRSQLTTQTYFDVIADMSPAGDGQSRKRRRPCECHDGGS